MIKVEQFLNQEAEFLEWCKNNLDGLILNINFKSPGTKSINKVHRVGCSSLTDSRNQGRMTTQSHPKYCSRDMTALIKVSENDNLPWGFCGTCLRDYVKQYK